MLDDINFSDEEDDFEDDILRDVKQKWQIPMNSKK